MGKEAKIFNGPNVSQKQIRSVEFKCIAALYIDIKSIEIDLRYLCFKKERNFTTHFQQCIGNNSNHTEWNVSLRKMA